MRKPTAFERELNRRLGPIFEEFERDMQRAQLSRIKDDPAAHRDTTLMGPKGISYRYFERKIARGRRVRFCWMTVPNAAGYYLTWQETRFANGDTKREFIRGHELRKDAKASAVKSYENLAPKPAG